MSSLAILIGIMKVKVYTIQYPNPTIQIPVLDVYIENELKIRQLSIPYNLLAMSSQELDDHRIEAWKYYKKVGAVQEFQDLEE